MRVDFLPGFQGLAKISQRLSEQVHARVSKEIIPRWGEDDFWK
jgi:hypothetical protein